MMNAAGSFKTRLPAAFLRPKMTLLLWKGLSDMKDPVKQEYLRKQDINTPTSHTNGG
jgi:hypothetical protein